NRVNFRNTIIIFTSNIGTRNLTQKGSLGFSDVKQAMDMKREAVMDELKSTMRPEFLNRIDEIVVFNSLEGKVLESIFDKMISDINDNLAVQSIRFKPNKRVRDFVIKEGFDPKYGARSIRRAISRMIEIPASEKIISEGVVIDPEKSEMEISMTLKQNNIDFKIKIKEKEITEQKKKVRKDNKTNESGKEEPLLQG
ncbi:MAG: ATP-dependent Clp protease ATP-binding subunit, partial [Bacteroidetes bacterium]